MSLKLIKPRFVPPLDEDFCPAALANRAFQAEVEESGAGVPLVIGLERAGGNISRFETTVFPDEHSQSKANLRYVERLVKFLLWQRGGWKLYIGGPPTIGHHIKSVYAPEGERQFDYHFLGETVYEKTFTVVPCAAAEVPPAQESGQPLGRHLDGYRIGLTWARRTGRCRRWSTAKPSSVKRSSGSRGSKPTPNTITLKS